VTTFAEFSLIQLIQKQVLA